jgi:hypothetical protein
MGSLKDLFGDTPYQLSPFVKLDRTPLSSMTLPEDIPVSVANLFEEISLMLYRQGHKRFSSDAVAHRMRWFHNVERNDSSFKINNNHTSVLARWFLANHPEMAGFFELRQSPSRN